MTFLHRHRVVNLRPGEFHATKEGLWIRTVLGSCVAVCLYDRAAGVGGMNHFMLPGSGPQEAQFPARYGVDAMKLLINRIVALGGAHGRLSAKAFGGANVLRLNSTLPTVADGNVSFLLRFLEDEGIPLQSSRLGGDDALDVRFFTGSARTLVRPVRSRLAKELAAAELQYRRRLEARLSRTAPPAELPRSRR
ncbi:MAG: chemotaxis protein CheD [Bryobacteraceae bacterium]|nr:chemotaxis protein CheD [Bryobacteraceae bacterium]